MRNVVNLLRWSTVPLFFAFATICADAAQLRAQAAVTLTNWREVKTVRFGRLQTRIEVSSLRTLRLVSESNKALLVSENLGPDSLRAWHDKVLAEFDKHSRAKYVFGNSILIEQSKMEDAMGYALTLADTNGVAHRVILPQLPMLSLNCQQ